jgi:2,3-bisphosphoglycerate-dependent phosphoglycerate mutase
VEQAERLAGILADLQIDRIISSTFLRARQSVVPLARRLNLEVQTDNRLVESLLTPGKADNWMEMLRQTFEDPELEFPGGESSNQALIRAICVVDEVRHSPRRAPLLMTHGRLLGVLLRHFNAGCSFEDWCKLTYPDLFRVTFEEGGASAVERLWRDPEQQPAGITRTDGKSSVIRKQKRRPLSGAAFSFLMNSLTYRPLPAM